MVKIRKGRKSPSSSSSSSSEVPLRTPERLPLRQGATDAARCDEPPQEDVENDEENLIDEEQDSQDQERIFSNDERDAGDLYSSNGSPLRTYEDDPDLPLPRGRIVVPAPQSRIPKRPRVDEEVSHRPMIETIINQSKVVTLDNEISEALDNSTTVAHLQL